MLKEPAMLQSPTARHHEPLEPANSLWATVNVRPLRRVALDPTPTPAAAEANSEQALLDLARLWREIQDLPANEVDAGLDHLLKRLCQLVSADGVRWELLGSMRPGKTVCVASQAWSQRPDLQTSQRATGPELSMTLPMRSSLRMHFTLLREAGAEPFNSRHRTTLEMTLAGLTRWLNWLALSHGPMSTAGPLPPHQRKVLLLLVTGLSEKQIASQLNLSTNTAHQYVTALYRRYGVRNRPSLAAQWLGVV
jgi:DNA-binding CsgD family transcriptional regulator